MDIESLKEIMDNVLNGDPAALLPDLSNVVGWVDLTMRVLVLAGPVCLLALGLYYLILPPREANHVMGYRTYWGMGSVEAWRFTQRVAGIVWGLLGLGLTAAMYFFGTEFAGMEPMEMVYTAGKYILLEIVLALVTTLVINVTAFVCYDWKGRPRFRKRER